MLTTKVKVRVVVVIGIVCVILGCSKKTTPTSPTTIITIPAIVYSWITDEAAYLQLSADPTPSLALSNVTLCWGGDTAYFPYKSQGSGYIAFNWFADTSWYYHSFWDTVLTVTLHSNYGKCSGITQIPAWPDIVTPRDYDTLSIGAVPCVWRKTARADWYNFSCDIWCPYDSTSWSYLFSINAWTVDTSITLPGSYFMRPGTMSYFVEIYLYAYRGPAPTVGSVSNMSGSIKGFLVSESAVDWHDFFVGKPPTENLRKNLSHRRQNIEERMKGYIARTR